MLLLKVTSGKYKIPEVYSLLNTNINNITQHKQEALYFQFLYDYTIYTD